MRARATVLPFVFALLAIGATASQADYVQSGKLLVSFEAGLAPSTLPRDQLVPVKVGFKGTFENLDASDTPALKRMVVRLSRGGQIISRGLPSCSEAKLTGLTSAEALRVCARAKIGEGTVSSAFRFSDGERARAKAELLLFNAPGGILMHVYATEPLKGTFLVPMSIHRGSGAFGTVLTARFPKIAAGYGYLTGFEMVIERSFTYRGERQGFVVASCPAPAGFNRVAFELARVTYSFVGGVQVRNTALGSCRVRGS
jgi:hypothetical protein